MSRISIREFARRKGVSDTAIRKMIANGYIRRAVKTNEKTGKPELESTIAEEEFAAHGGGVHSTNYPGSKRSNRKPNADPEDHPVNQASADDAHEKVESAGTLVKARKLEAVYRANLTKTKYEKEIGKLVEKDKVYRTLFEWGQEMKNELLTVPDRVIDQVLAAPTRTESITVLYDEIARVLTKMTTLGDRNLIPER